MVRYRFGFTLLAALALGACTQTTRPDRDDKATPASREYFGTLEPLASDAIYFVVTDRFVNGDPGNDHRDQGGVHPTFDIPLPCDDGIVAHLGYLGGDFRGLLDNADYIREMGFGAVWITPIVDNPDEAFTGGDEVTCTSFLTDRGKAGYHGYWGMNFYRLDEHLPSPGLGFAELTRGLHEKGLKTVLDIVANHSSPAWSMPEKQLGFGQVFDASGTLLADHGNLPPERLDPAHEPLQRWYNTKPDLAQLGDFNPDNPALMDYLVGAYRQWIAQGADAFRVDTIGHQPLDFWNRFAARIRADHPGFFMFGEAFDYDAAKIAPYTWNENGRYSVLDFPMKQAIAATFEKPGGDFAALAPALALEGGPYQNPYELTTFYDNHDMARFAGSDNAFIDAHNWLFTARGIPVVYYGSEIGFMRGHAEHHGNRNYFGTEGIAAARLHPIHAALSRVAHARKDSVALQRGLQLDLELAGDRAAFYRVYEHDGVAQTALVLLNKGDSAQTFMLGAQQQPGVWHDALNPDAPPLTIAANAAPSLSVPAHGVAIWLLDAPISRPALRARLDQLMAGRERRTSGAR
ncbi:alpha-amylase family glycosyl hydrolase [Dokdonella immobilis]|uniref:Cyclomaltodextrin glucanotransferase n=1 Tax=Dokdonella immobilis TaxID=578942 RepID=A0A1I4W9D7_9GAMM|nr:alpha-amylase family glycosyl hydrolase [Dokdonella immobilis]SFN10258.1 cyclomaltodextrin glucanotransferase [Dokdonella immobilis]